MNRQIAFVRRPDGMPSPDVCAPREAAVPALADGEVLCRNLILSVDPYIRLKMYDRRSYTPPLEIGQTIPGRTVAQVVQTRSARLAAGDLVVTSGGWQDYAAVPAEAAKKIDASLAPLGAWLGPLGMTGLTAYAGLLDIGRPQRGETLVVSGAGGAVGSLVGQIGAILGCRTVGIAGSEAKCASVTRTFNFDACVNYRSPDFAESLAKSCQTGCDIYFDNVGGTISLAVASHFNDFARIAVCGLISQYNGQRPGATNAYDELLRLILTRRLSVRGFIVSDLADRYPDFEADMSNWLREGRIVWREHVHKGFDHIVPAFLGMLAGENTGKTMVHLADPGSY